MYPFRRKRQKAEFIRPPNLLKAKVGSGGLDDEILNRAQELLESNDVDFIPMAEIYMGAMAQGIEQARHATADQDKDKILSRIIYPAMQLKANGSMFRYPLVTAVAARLIDFCEKVYVLDKNVIEIIFACHTTIRAIILGNITGSGSERGQNLIDAIDEATRRYAKRYPDNIK